MEFYENVRDELNIPIEYAPLNPDSAYGASILGDTYKARVWLRTDISRRAFSHTAAHELSHILQTLRGFDKVGKPVEMPEGSDEHRVGEFLTGAVECVAIDAMLAAFRLDARDSVKMRFETFRRNLISLGPRRSQPGTPSFAIWTLRCIRAALEEPPHQWKILHDWFDSHWPEVAQVGEALIDEMASLDRNTPSGRRATYRLLVRLPGITGNVVIYNRTTGEEF